MLLEYFGETDAAACGTCDVCKSLQALELTAFEFEIITKEIKKLLVKPAAYETVLLKLKGDQLKKQQVIKWLLDNKKIIYRVDGNLEWGSE